jgi:proteasome lid subunit RPN8/RPN11
MDSAISSVRIAGTVLAAIVDHAAAALPAEACGLVVGCDSAIDAAIPAANVAADPLGAFEIDRATLLRVYRAARGEGRRVVGWYHSHPNGIGARSRTVGCG